MLASTMGVLCLMFAAQPERTSEAAKEELKKFQGTWKIELQEEDGKKLADADLRGRTISFGMNLLLVRSKGLAEQLAKIKIDPAKKTINASVDKGTREGDILPGIYEFNADTLKICLGTDDARPKEFKGGPNQLLMICKRLPVTMGEADLSGKYESESIDITGRRIRYDAAIERMGDSYLVLYTVRGKLVYFGTGIRKGNIFAMGWASQGQPGITLYEIEKGNRLVGNFTEVGGPGFLGTETLTPVAKK
jgi:uncharacterized protein (TIGR03067 family)